VRGAVGDGDVRRLLVSGVEQSVQAACRFTDGLEVEPRGGDCRNSPELSARRRRDLRCLGFVSAGLFRYLVGFFIATQEAPDHDQAPVTCNPKLATPTWERVARRGIPPNLRFARRVHFRTSRSGSPAMSMGPL
jgi:hypothetical protein